MMLWAALWVRMRLDDDHAAGVLRRYEGAPSRRGTGTAAVRSEHRAGVQSTEIGYPCGTIELARSVADLVAAAAPGRALIGQKNHGLTITGPDLHDIFLRIEGRLQTTVPVAA